MLKRIYLLTMLSAIPAVSFSQAPTWTQQGPRPTGLHVEDVQVLSPTEAWAVVESGAVLHTTDAGMSWTKQDLATNSLKEVFFVDQTHGWLVGNAIFSTTDGGAKWTKNSWAPGTLNGVYFVDRLHGWLTGAGTVHRTTDGGRTWAWASLPKFTTCHGVFFHDTKNGWVSNINGELYETHDGGSTWRLNHKEGLNLNTIWFANPSTGFAVASDRVLRTVNGGTSWQTFFLPNGTWGFEACFLDATRAWIVGQGMNVVTTDDGWQTATVRVARGPGPSLLGVSFADSRFGLAVGERGRIVATGDGGATWRQRDSGGMDAHGVDANDVAHAWIALERGMIARTTNGGAQWITEPVAGFSEFSAVQDIDFLDDNLIGWAAGTDKAFAGKNGRISRSDDGGRTWTLQYSNLDFFFNAVCAVDDKTVFAGGVHPFSSFDMVRTKDGGRTWAPVAVGLGIINGIDFADPKHGWAVGGQIIATTDGGDTWSKQLLPGDSLNAVDFVDAQNGWVVGWNGQVFRTSNGGSTWQQISNPLFGAKTLLGVCAVDKNTVWISGPEGFVVRTLDGGKTWTPEQVNFAPGYKADFTGIDFIDADYGWVSGGPRVDNGGPWKRAAGAPPGFALLSERIRRGFTSRLHITGASPGELLVTAFSATGIAPMPCSPSAGLCLGLLPPWFVLSVGSADAAGAMHVSIPMPSSAPFIELHFQAFRINPTSAKIASSNTTSTYIEP